MSMHDPAMQRIVQREGLVWRDDDPGSPVDGMVRIGISKAEQDFLRSISFGLHVLEIGTGIGISTLALREYAAHVDTIDTDPWVHETIFPEVKSATVTCHTGRHSIRRAARFDLAFIDGAHDTKSVISDIDFAEAHMGRGMIVVHDAREDRVRAALPPDCDVVPTLFGLGILWVGWEEQP